MLLPALMGYFLTKNTVRDRLKVVTESQVISTNPTVLCLIVHRVAMVKEKYLETEFFSRSGNFVDGQGNLERIWKVREKSGNSKINGYGRQFQKIYSVQEGKGYTFS